MADRVWFPLWRDDWDNYEHLFWDEHAVWEQAMDSWKYRRPEILPFDLPYFIVNRGLKSMFMFPEAASWHTGIGSSDPVDEDTPGREFMQELTKIRLPILFRCRQMDIDVLKNLFSTITPPGPWPDIMDALKTFAAQENYTFIIPTPYADADTMSKYLTIVDYLKSREEDLGHPINYITSKIVCFKADPAVRQQLLIEASEWLEIDTEVLTPLIVEVDPPKDYYKIVERYGRYPWPPVG